METIEQIIEKAGGKQAVADRFETSTANVRNQARDGKLPAAWFAALEDMTGQPLPRHLFSFKGLDGSPARG